MKEYNKLRALFSNFVRLDDSILRFEKLGGGLINDSYLVELRKSGTDESQDFVFQRLHKIFSPSVNDDIAALTKELQGKNVKVPSLIPSLDGANCVQVKEGDLAGVWRVLSKMEGRCIQRVENLEQIMSAAKNLAAFHAALLESAYEFKFSRRGVHDFERHKNHLMSTLENAKGHRLYGVVKAQAEAIMRFIETEIDTKKASSLPHRIIHGDPKISNFLFIGNEVSAILDLDTMARSSLDHEIGDALRSWANLADENSKPEVSVAYFKGAISSYCEAAPWLEEEEIASFSKAAVCIATELSLRFLADALLENYFRFDPKVAPSHGEHSLLRAKYQFELAVDFRDKILK